MTVISRRRRSGIIVAATAVVVALAIAFTAWQVSLRDRVVGAMTVAGVDVGSLSREQVAARLTEELWPQISTARLDVGADVPRAVSLTHLGISLDADATATAACAGGRRDLRLGGLSVWLPGGMSETEPIIRIDDGVLAQGLMPIREIVDVPAQDARLKLQPGWGVTIVPSKDGLIIDADELGRRIAAAAADGRAFSGAIPKRPAVATVSNEVAEARAALATEYVAGPIALRHAARTIVLSPKDIADMVSVNTAASADAYPLTFDNQRAKARLRKLLAWAERPPVDAEIIVGRSGGIVVTQSKDGELLDMDYLVEDLNDAARKSGLRRVMVSTSPALARLTSEDVRSMGLASLGSQFTTYFDPANTARARNIALAAKLVDGTMVGPGTVFSLNEAMGPRTTNRGFDYAPVIAADGVLRQGVGGGICQYATTLFNAVLYAGLPVVDRRPHLLYISHYPIGRDATVAWGSIDFKFRNDTGRQLLIRSWVNGGALTVAIVGKTGRTVSLTAGKFSNVRKPAHGKNNPRVIHDADLGPGVVRWEQGVDGRSIKVQRVVRDSGGKLLFRDSFASTYEPLDWVKRVGI